MFRENEAFSGFSVDDIAVAQRFYGETLGLQVTMNAMSNLDITLGTGARILLYPKANHESATYTVLNFLVPDIDAAVSELVAAGITMEHYDFPEMKQDENGVMRGDDRGPSIAWFKDPAGNVIAVIEANASL
jgi:catechol 2,3-dioxygenase-like lactoylglutathione lyase family enzyme